MSEGDAGTCLRSTRRRWAAGNKAEVGKRSLISGGSTQGSVAHKHHYHEGRHGPGFLESGATGVGSQSKGITRVLLCFSRYLVATLVATFVLGSGRVLGWGQWVVEVGGPVELKGF